MLVDFKTILNYAVVAIPPIIACMAFFVRIETQLTAMKTDIVWLKQKSQERRSCYNNDTQPGD